MRKIFGTEKALNSWRRNASAGDAKATVRQRIPDLTRQRHQKKLN